MSNERAAKTFFGGKKETSVKEKTMVLTAGICECFNI
jgi:hypothetical protein